MPFQVRKPQGDWAGAVAVLVLTPVAPAAAQEQDEALAYHAWFAANQAQDNEKAVAAAEAYLEKFPSGQYAEFLSKWLAPAKLSKLNEAIKAGQVDQFAVDFGGHVAGVAEETDRPGPDGRASMLQEPPGHGVVESGGRGQKYEIQGTGIEVVGWVEDPDTYPIQPKPHSFEFLREVAHLRPRTNTFGAITRVRPRLKSLMGVAVVIPVFIGAFDMLAENIHLSACIIDVVFAIDRITRRFQQVTQGGAI